MTEYLGAQRIGIDPRAFIVGLIGASVISFLLGVWASPWLISWLSTP